MRDQQQPVFKKSSFCQDGSCVEVAFASTETVLVRDNKNLTSLCIPVGAAAWRSFLHGLDEEVSGA